jgi:hypothetical protein
MNVMTAKEEGKEPTAKEIAIESLLRSQKEGLPQTRDAFYHNNNNGERSYSALGAYIITSLTMMNHYMSNSLKMETGVHCHILLKW